MEAITLQEIARAVQASAPASLPAAPVSVVCTDTRQLVPGCLFVALKGERFDGHRFVARALAEGAAAAIIAQAQAEAVRAEVAGAGTLLVVDDPLRALGDLAGWYRSRFAIPVVGVTGSVGKTSTKEMLAAILGRRAPVVCTQANHNNEIGLPLTLFALESQHTAAVVELAMRGRGQIAYLANIARPRVGVITNIGTSHLELLGSQEAIARAKGELLEALPPDGAAVLPAADPFLPLLRSLSSAPVTTFGFAGEGSPDVAVADLMVEPTESRFTLQALGVSVSVRLPLPGRHNALNAAAAAAGALRAGATLADVAAGLEAARLPEMRMQVTRTASGITVLNDAYNASPASMAAALEHLAHLPGARRLAVLGDMLELGDGSRAGHREVGRHAAGLDLLIAVGERARDLADGAREAGMAAERVLTCDDAAAALALLRQVVQPGDAVLVKASRGMRLEIVSEGLESADG
jgi:UDP-N-acetylmuramoyl-tripeptide--D-alanyl-D-alanine ligase